MSERPAIILPEIVEACVNIGAWVRDARSRSEVEKGPIWYLEIDAETTMERDVVAICNPQTRSSRRPGTAPSNGAKIEAPGGSPWLVSTTLLSSNEL